jgi:hypothetical protein
VEPGVVKATFRNFQMTSVAGTRPAPDSQGPGVFKFGSQERGVCGSERTRVSVCVRKRERKKEREKEECVCV